MEGRAREICDGKKIVLRPESGLTFAYRASINPSRGAGEELRLFFLPDTIL